MRIQRLLLRFPALVAAGCVPVVACVAQVGPGVTPGSGGTTPGAQGGTGAGPSTGGSGAPTGSGGGSVGSGGASAGTGATAGGVGTGSGGAALAPKDAGRVTMRLLNRVEYNNTVRDLLGTALQPAATFLNDAPEFGFDNNGDMLSVSPAHARQYQLASEQLAAEAITPARRGTIVTCDLAAAGDTCSRAIITAFGARAYRRPLTAAEVTGYLGLMTAARGVGATADEAVRTVIEAFLTSAHFLFRVEMDPDPVSLVAHPVGSYEMASRLSYLVYRSMPDKALFDAASAGKLSAPADLQAQLTRMLADPKGTTFAQEFSTQWIGVRNLEQNQFDKTLFPMYSPALTASMKQEVISFFDSFLKENLPVTQLLTAKFSYIDDNLAKLYGVPAVGTAGVMRKTALDTPQRGGGLLTMAGPLAVTSYPIRTSLVKRGAWVMTEMLCTEPPPPPPDVPPLPEGQLMGTQREILEMHRSNLGCVGCHVIMDNLGIALENYDALGAWRTMERGEVIDAQGKLPSGETFVGGPAMAAVVAADPRFKACVTGKLLTYALGRSLLPGDEGYVAEMSAGPQGTAPGVRDILNKLVASEPFTMRHGEAPAAAGGVKP